MNSGNLALGRQLGELRQGRDAIGTQFPCERTRHSRDEGQVIGVFPLLGAALGPAARFTQRARFWRRAVRVPANERQEPLDRGVTVVDVVIQSEAERATVAEHDVRAGGHELLNERDKSRIQAELNDVLWLGGSRELRVDDFVGVVAERGRRGDPEEKVGVAVPRPVRERPLIDDIDTAAHRFGGRSRHELDRIATRDFTHRPSLDAKLIEVRVLVIDAFLLQQVEVGIVSVGGRSNVSAYHQEVERRGVRTAEEVEEVLGRVERRRLVDLHVRCGLTPRQRAPG